MVLTVLLFLKRNTVHKGGELNHHGPCSCIAYVLFERASGPGQPLYSENCLAVYVLEISSRPHEIMDFLIPMVPLTPVHCKP